MKYECTIVTSFVERHIVFVFKYEFVSAEATATKIQQLALYL